LKSKLNHVVA